MPEKKLLTINKNKGININQKKQMTMNHQLKTIGELQWPRSHLTKPDLKIQCLDSEAGGHYHLVHSFVLFVLGIYWRKAILFANRNRRPLVDIRR